MRPPVKSNCCNKEAFQAVGASALIPGLAAAADPSASPAATPSATSTTPPNTVPGGHAGMPGRGGYPMGADDITSAAKALGMTEADVTSALESGQTLAQLAATKNVDVQTLIDAMVAAEKAEIQADLASGAITQAEADQQIANLTQHETDEVNGTFMGGGPGGPAARWSSKRRRRRRCAGRHFERVVEQHCSDYDLGHNLQLASRSTTQPDLRGARTSFRAPCLRAAHVPKKRGQHRLRERPPGRHVVAAWHLERPDIVAACHQPLVQTVGRGLDPRVVVRAVAKEHAHAVRGAGVGALEQRLPAVRRIHPRTVGRWRHKECGAQRADAGKPAGIVERHVQGRITAHRQAADIQRTTGSVTLRHDGQQLVDDVLLVRTVRIAVRRGHGIDAIAVVDPRRNDRDRRDRAGVDESLSHRINPDARGEGAATHPLAFAAAAAVKQDQDRRVCARSGAWRRVNLDRHIPGQRAARDSRGITQRRATRDGNGCRDHCDGQAHRHVSMTDALDMRDAGAGNDLLDNLGLGVGIVLHVLPGPLRWLALGVLVQPAVGRI